MSRVPPIEIDKLTPEQRRLHDEIAGARSGHVRGPFAIWLRLPQIADKANQLGNVLRRGGKLERRLFELMVLTIARRWSAQYEWFAHEKNALAAGLATDVVEAIRARQVPNFAREDERLIYEIVTEIDETRTLSQPNYERAVDALGLDLLIELVTAAGFYSSVAMMINVFEAPVPGGERPLP
ncbi:MAG TPA: carboxymuconolactone decarboxylase family protein [Dehalococcoidia bacterium]|nr:carboxymuconolactone decarboxylase family protein [Dehalococcoidia bacterium]